MKRNHYVPQSYLRAFAADPDRREKIWRFGKNEGDPELKPIDKVAYRHYLYVPKDETGFRIQITAANPDDQIDLLCEVLGEISERFELQHEQHRRLMLRARESRG